MLLFYLVIQYSLSCIFCQYYIIFKIHKYMFSPDRSFTSIDYIDKPYRFPDLEKMLDTECDIILPPKRHYPYSIVVSQINIVIL